MICSKCKKRPAVLFVQRMENGKAVNEGLCWVCAKEAGLPQISDIMNQMGITEDEMEAMSQQLMEFADGDSFEPGGADTMPNFLQNLFGSEKPTVSKEQPKKKSPNINFWIPIVQTCVKRHATVSSTGLSDVRMKFTVWYRF